MKIADLEFDARMPAIAINVQGRGLKAVFGSLEPVAASSWTAAVNPAGSGVIENAAKAGITDASHPVRREQRHRCAAF